jgi:hypothetical protein
MILLFPADVLRPRRVDEHFAGEADAAREAGFPVALVDHDAAARGDSAGAVARVPGDATAIYRGWMLSSDRYADFDAALAKRSVRLYTGAQQYRRGHELPGWYAGLSAFTPTSLWTTGSDRADFETVRVALGSGPAVLRDYSKSMKHHWHEAAYIPDLADATQAWSVAKRMAKLRGDDLAGGFVVRRYEAFTGAEVRTWWINGTCRLVTAPPTPRTSYHRTTSTSPCCGPPSPPWPCRSSPSTSPDAPTGHGGSSNSVTARSATAPPAHHPQT